MKFTQTADAPDIGAQSSSSARSGAPRQHAELELGAPDGGVTDLA